MSRLGYQPRGGKFPHPNELTLVRDLPPALAERALPFVTTYSGSSQINVADAAPEVIASLPGVTQDSLHTFLAQRQASPNAKQLLPQTAQQFVTLESGQTFRVKVRTSNSGRVASAEVVILFFDDGDQPFAVLSWRDRSTELFGY
jgi:general secretion pathway protein K